ncbi:MAG: murein L,D-transpeptidase catalytic domain-containing protein [Pseudobdellovibrionaceae bacterium]
MGASKKINHWLDAIFKRLFSAIAVIILVITSIPQAKAFSSPAQRCQAMQDISLLQRSVIVDESSGEEVSLLDVALLSGVSRQRLVQAFLWFDANKYRIKNQKYLTLIDYSLPSVEERMFVFNLCNGLYKKFQVAHGSGSDMNHDGIAQKFTNQSGSYASSLGIFLTDETYFSQHFNSTALRLRGLSSTNSNAYGRGLVMHAAGYVTQEWGQCSGSSKNSSLSCAMNLFRKNRKQYLDPVTRSLLQGQSRALDFSNLFRNGYIDWKRIKIKNTLLGRSQGCPALHPVVAEYIIPRIQKGSVIYAFN